MWKVISEQSSLGSVDIGAIKLDANFRVDIPTLLIWHRAIYKDEETRAALLSMLK